MVDMNEDDKIIAANNGLYYHDIWEDSETKLLDLDEVGFPIIAWNCCGEGGTPQPITFEGEKSTGNAYAIRHQSFFYFEEESFRTYDNLISHLNNTFKMMKIGTQLERNI